VSENHIAEYLNRCTDEELHNLRGALHHFFCRTIEGRKLWSFFTRTIFMTSSYVPGNTEATIFREGQRSMLLFISDLIESYDKELEKNERRSYDGPTDYTAAE